MEAEQAFSVASLYTISDRAWKQEPDDALAVSKLSERVRGGQEAEESKRSQLVASASLCAV
ncbi:hypothetical protein E4U21_001995 [Claviceps maximensis]|nr:hypothetical protein E4U21_001995 [Claviceps maximensis]